MFKIGDNIMCINNYKVYGITINKYYTIISFGYDKQFICLADDENINRFYNIDRFTKDIRKIRKQKLKKLYEKAF